MTLGEIIKNYRDGHDLSQRQFAEASGLSNGYISMLEKNVNPKTGLPMASSLSAIKKIASVMNMSAYALLDQMDDVPIEISGVANFIYEAPTIEERERLTEFVGLFDMLPEGKKAHIISEIKGLLSEQQLHSEPIPAV